MNKAIEWIDKIDAHVVRCILRTFVAALLLTACAALAQAPIPGEGGGDPAADPALDPSVPPVILTNVVVQSIGEERALEELPPGLIFLDADSGKLMVADEDDPHGRAVCACKGWPDYHNLTNTLRVNGHRIELNAAYSMQAEGEVLSVRAGTNAVLQILHSPQGELAPLTCTYETDRTLLLTANAPADSTLLICTNLMESPQWSTATNAVIVETTDAATTWRITLLDRPVPEFYRVLSSISLDAGIYARLPLHATQGIDIDTTNGLTMGDTTWTKLPDIGTIATNAADAAVAPVAGDLADHAADTDNPHGVTAEQVGALPLTGGTVTGNLSVVDRGDNLSGNFTWGKNVTNNGYRCFVGGENAYASGFCGFSTGYRTTSTGFAGNATGGLTTAGETYSDAHGFAARATNRISYVWSGVEDAGHPYGSHGAGTWNIDPRGGLGGLYVGETNFSSEAWTFVLTNGQSVTKHVVLYGD